MRTVRAIAWCAGWLLLAAVPRAQATETVTLYVTNAQGTVVAEMTPQGQVTYTAAYQPYGKQIVGVPQSGPGYTGHVNDPDTGLVYMQQRYYDPEIGRFLSVDPVGPASGNAFNFGRYTYANDNPYRYTDPDGRCADGTCDIMVQQYAAYANAHPGTTLSPLAKVGLTVMLATSGVGDVVVLAKGAATIDKVFSDVRAEATITRYMGPEEAKVSARTGEIPNVGRDGIQRPTHVTTDAPVNSAAKAQEKYELPTAPTHNVTVPANRVSDLGPTPDGRSVTSGGGSQNATDQPIPIKPEEIKQLDQ